MAWRETLRVEGCHWDSGAASAVALIAALLRIAARSRDEIRVDHGDMDLENEQDSLERAVSLLLRRFVGPIPCEFLEARLLDALCAALEACPLRPGITALLTARVIDAHIGRELIDGFRAFHGTRLAPGDPVPVVRFPCERLAREEREEALMLLGKRTGDPKLRGDTFDHTDHLRLAPAAVTDLRVRLVWADDWLAPIRSSTRFAFGVTNAVAPGEELEWKEYSVGSRACFYGVVPKDVVEQERRISNILRDAADGDASIVVLPELSVTAEMLQSLQGKGLLDPLPLVVAGSYHEHPEQRGPGQNLCKVYAYGDEVHVHRKFSDFHYAVQGQPERRCHEHLRREDGTSGFDLLVGSQGTVVVTVCKDVLGEVQELVRKLAPSLLLVPAMSEETADFEAVAGNLARDPQTFTAIACAGSGRQVIFGRPNRFEPVISCRYESGLCVILTLSGQFIDQPSIN